MAEPYMSEIRIFSFNFAPRNWAQCNGQTMAINQNQALFALLGTMYGGNGQTTFALPNLQGSVAMHVGSGLAQGQSGGEQNHTLTLAEMPAHFHNAVASSIGPNASTPQNNYWASNTGFNPYGTAANGFMSTDAVANAGQGQPHSNMAPYLTLNYCIALQGIFPSRN